MAAGGRQRHPTGRGTVGDSAEQFAQPKGAAARREKKARFAADVEVRHRLEAAYERQ
jgi:hypothetical protein